MTRILALDTSTEACSCALWLDGEEHGTFELAPQKHTKLILPMIDQLLSDSGVAKTSLDAIAFGRGPGSFTGVRIAVSIAQGIAFSLERPVVPVSTLSALALAAIREHQSENVIALMDARMGEVYHARFCASKSGLPQLDGEEAVLKPHGVPVPAGEQWLSIGSAWKAHGEALTELLGDSVSESFPGHWPDAKYMAELAAHAYDAGEAVAPELGLPVYLRDKVAETTAERELKRKLKAEK